MAQLEREKFCCSICLDILKDPVSIPCGHSYCMSCINSFWDGENKKETCSCPQCRQTFTPRPAPGTNFMLAELVEQLKNTGLQPAAVHGYAGPEDVSCDVCTGRKLKAAKSCLTCPASYCEKHLQPHYNAAPLQKHKLVDPSEKFQENVCSRHDEVMKIFCRTDQQSICYLCSVEEHKGHDTVSVAAERAERQKELEGSQRNIQQWIQDREKDVKLLQQELEAISRSADKAVKHSEKIFTELIRVLRKRSSKVKQQIRSQQETQESGIKDVEEKLQQEIRELRRKDAELELLSHTEDHNQFLNSYASLPQLSEDTSRIKIRPLRHFEDVTLAVAELRDKIQDVLKDTWTKISLAVIDVDILLSEPEPKTRAEFLRYSRELTLDPNTTNPWLLLSEGNRKAERVEQQVSYSPHPDRFTGYSQVLSREGLTGRCYWEVESRGLGAGVAVTYKNINRAAKLDNCRFGGNDQSWALRCHVNEGYKYWFNNMCTPLPGTVSSRVGVYLDHRAGVLSFYSVSKTMTLIHRVQTTFTQPLHAGLRLYAYKDTAEFCRLK